MIAVTISFVQLQILLSIPTCRYERPFSPRTHAVKLAYSTRVAIVNATLPNITSAGARPPLKIHFHSLTPNLEQRILMDPYLRHGNYACGDGANAPPPAAAIVTTDVAAQVITAHVTPIIGDTTQHTTVTTQEYHAST